MGVGCPCRGGRPKNKTAGGGLGGRAQRLPPRWNMLRDSPSVRMIFGALGSQLFVWGLRFI